MDASLQNGNKVRNHRNPSLIWSGIGDEVSARADSDDDGKTIGQEFGDPNCI
ncbi:hypothetical protein TrispH2_010854 [Trichoplax sp. H2]|nr:hypothetical protein TrispH2_010854 [Trichoplax sp. H2]|eukprot:RDD37775.1 hypothetical protein TrispH2_010854 [Trichoplax sp. H2]